ncbi:hypothetical protein [Polynucleobacter sp. MWH-Braz-FAM2G]|uniref:hypothetical protein n=1 Tax=Polynucleobacter sp. MWH-Braz-FAM2G TaxID=1855883 RepID=UPI001BFDF92B|nr:hypothetical protein [Polynucleobacter sp. MWH-Braz-FAM2G]QWD91098.1 hypothetical protein FD973_01800 [Polynucleobacter sp. MWH-Braz-FAM2G]
MSSDTFVWTEVYNCGEIGAVAISSFLKHHPNIVVHVFGSAEDLLLIPDSATVMKIMLPSGFGRGLSSWLWRKLGAGSSSITEDYLKNGFARGHLGTARLWAYLINCRPEAKMIHFDSDIIFLGDVVTELKKRLDTYDLVGPVRNYKHNPNNLDHVRHLADVTQTYCFGFNKHKINCHRYGELVRMCLGSYNPKEHPVIDFFDPVMFEILGNRGSISFLNHDEVGGCNLQGSRLNAFSAVNDFATPFKIDFGSKLIHFSAVGSGVNIYRNKTVRMPESYRKYALDRYALFTKVFYNHDIGIDLSSYETLIEHLKKIDTKQWIYQNDSIKVG